VRSDEQLRSLTWSQRVQGTPLALLKSAETEVRLASGQPGLAVGERRGPGAPGHSETEVTIEMRPALTGFFPRFGGFMVRRAASPRSTRRSTGSSGSVAERAEPPVMRWWGWATRPIPRACPPRAGLLSETVGIGTTPSPPVALGRVRLAAPRIPGAVLAQLRQLVGTENVRRRPHERVVHAAGKGYHPIWCACCAASPRALRTRSLHPAGHGQVLALPRALSAGLGRGRSLRGRHERRRWRSRRWPASMPASSRVDMGRMGSVLALDRESATVTVQAGMRAKALEQHLAARGLTLGHSPAVIRVRLARRLRGHALGRAVLDGLRGDREDGARPALRRAEHRDRAPARAREPRPGRACASCWSARRAPLG